MSGLSASAYHRSAPLSSDNFLPSTSAYQARSRMHVLICHPKYPLQKAEIRPNHGGSMPLDSEEELVYFTHDNSLPLQDNVITKTTEFKVTESGSRGDEVERVHVMLKPWQRQGG
jgi:hypothetical protein